MEIEKAAVRSAAAKRKEEDTGGIDRSTQLAGKVSKLPSRLSLNLFIKEFLQEKESNTDK